MAKIKVSRKPIDLKTRRQIADLLLAKQDPNSIYQRLVSAGFDEYGAQREIRAAIEHPYLQAARDLTLRMDKQHWVLDIYRRLEKMALESKPIERKYKLTRQDFLRDYYTTNRPVVIQGVMDSWKAINKWTPAYLKQQFGDKILEVQSNRNSDKFYELNCAQHKSMMSMKEYVDIVTSIGETNDYYITARNASHNGEVLKGLWEDIEVFPEYLDPTSQHKGFFWFGPAGTITPLHHDLTNNFMAQVRGRKLIKIVSACHWPNVYNHNNCFSRIDMDNIDYQQYPLFKNVQVQEVLLEPGEVLFLPVGCWHYVRALDISITVSFTNFLFDNDFYSNYTSHGELESARLY